MKKLFLILFMVVVVVALVFGGCGGKEPEAKTLKIGLVYGLTGPGSQMQLAKVKTHEMCAEYINDRGGITINGDKYLIELVAADNENSPAGSVTAATKLVHQDQVKFVIGCVVPVQCDAVASVTEPAQVLYVAERTDIVHPDRPYYFTPNYGFASPLPGLYEALLELYPGVNKIGYLVEDEAGARAVADLSHNIARGHGLTVLEPVIHPWEAPEYAPEWTKVLGMEPDAVDQGLKMPDSTAACVRQGRELGYNGPIIAAIPGDPHLIINMIGKEYATDFIYAAFDVYGPEAPPMVKEIVELWDSKYSEAFDADSPETWDAMWVLKQAIEKAQSIDPTAVAKAWETMDTFESCKGTGRMGGAQTFGINHMGFAPCPVTRLQNGEIEFIKWFDPWVP
jgi:branched-chain amino acid transport system substrate-binding protein